MITRPCCRRRVLAHGGVGCSRVGVSPQDLAHVVRQNNTLLDINVFAGAVGIDQHTKPLQGRPRLVVLVWERTTARRNMTYFQLSCRGATVQ